MHPSSSTGASNDAKRWEGVSFVDWTVWHYKLTILDVITKIVTVLYFCALWIWKKMFIAALRRLGDYMSNVNFHPNT